MAEKIWNNLINWQSDDDYLISEWQFAYSENVDVKRTWFEFWVSPAPVKVNFTTAEINWFIWLKNNSWTERLFYYWSWWKVFNDTSSDNTAEFTCTGSVKVVNAVEFWDYVYFIQNSWSAVTFYRDTKSNLVAETYSWATFSPTWDAVPTPWFSNIKVIVLYDKFVVWIGKSLYSIDSLWVWKKMKTFPDDIMWLTAFNDLLAVYTSNWWMYYVSSETGVIQEYKPLKVNIRNVEQIWWIDYIIAWYSSSSSEFYYMNWWSLTPIKKAKRTLVNYPVWTNWSTTENLKNNFWFPIIAVKDDVVLIDRWASYDKIVHYWNDNDNYPRVFSNILSVNSQTRNSRAITAIYYWKERIYYYYNDLTSDWVDYVSIFSGSPYQSVAYLFTEIFDAGIKIKKKQVKQLCIAYSWTDATNTIVLSRSVDWWAYEEIATINTSWFRQKIQNPWDFKTIQYKIKIKWTAKFRELYLDYNVVEND